MKIRTRIVSFIMLLICFIGLFPNAILIQAQTTNLPRVYDYADIFTDEEEALLEPMLRTTSDDNGADVIIYTIEHTDGSDLDIYTEQIAYNSGFSKNVVILMVNMDSSHREVLLQAYDTSEEFINDKRAQHITDKMVPDMKEGDYYDAMLLFNKKVNFFFEHKKPVATAGQIAIEVGIALVLALIIVLCMVLGASGKNTTTCNTYLDASTSKILAKRDTYTHTTTKRTKIERNNSSSGSGGKGGGGHSTGRSSF